jgi:glycosyltransferase involved in cell wall biosynthesis
MPVRNEERDLVASVSRILDQAYPGEIELIMAVGPSTDRTEQVAAELASADPRVRVVDNPTGRTPAALNLAIAAARFDHVVRVDGHGLLPDGYVKTAIETIERTGADNVGGMMVPEGATAFERAVAAAMSSRIGIGGARFHVGGDEGQAETVYLGVFRRAMLERLGGFDEEFVRAQDWELNHRIRRAGGKVWFTPNLRVTYRPRRSLSALASQFYRTGQWRRQVMKAYPETISLRYLSPPAAVAALAVGSAAAVLGVLMDTALLVLGVVAPLGYIATVTAGSAVLAPRLPRTSWLWLLLVLPTMHLAWGTGFLRGPPRSRR